MMSPVSLMSPAMRSWEPFACQVCPLDFAIANLELLQRYALKCHEGGYPSLQAMDCDPWSKQPALQGSRVGCYASAAERPLSLEDEPILPPCVSSQHCDLLGWNALKLMNPRSLKFESFALETLF